MTQHVYSSHSSTTPTGTLDIDLHNIPDAAKTSTECGLHQLELDDPDKTTILKTNKRVNLFEKKRLKGWWPVFEQVTPEEKELTVRAMAD